MFSLVLQQRAGQANSGSGNHYMTMKRWDGGAYVDLTVAKRWDGSAWVDLTIARRWDGSNWIDIPLPGGGSGGVSLTGTASINETVVDSAPVKTITTSPAALTTTGGTGPYTYSWTKVSGDSAINADTPTTEDTTFTVNAFKNTTYNTLFRCTVTDSLAATATHDVNVTITYEF